MKGAVGRGFIMADGSVSIQDDGIIGLKKHAKPTGFRLKAPEADGTHGDNVKMC